MGRPKMKITQDMIDTVVSMYINGKPISEIEKKIGHSDKIIYNILKDNNVVLNRKEIVLTDLQKEKMKELHEDGLSYKEIAREIKVCSGTKVYETLKEMGVTNSFNPEKILSIIDENNKHQGNRKYYFDEHIFDEINTPDKAYCIGLFMADGCNHSNNNTFSIGL